MASMILALRRRLLLQRGGEGSSKSSENRVLAKHVLVVVNDKVIVTSFTNVIVDIEVVVMAGAPDKSELISLT